MKSTTSMLITAAILFAAVATPIQLAAQQHAHYKLIDLGTFGGPQSYVNIPNNYASVLNDRGTVAGWADTSTRDPYPSFCFNEDCFVSHAFQSQNGASRDLGPLPGGSSSRANWISANGIIAGVSENGEIDPMFPGFPEFRGVLWKDGQITDLGTLPEGGYESVANAVNSRGQVVGFATNTTPDNFSLFGTTQARAFLWQNGVMRDLGTLGGTDAVAALVNNRGQIVGESYTSSTPSAYCANNLGFPLTTGAFLWENGEMKNLGSFGGTCTFAADLNNRGEVVGISALAGDLFQHAFLWKHGSLTELTNASGGNNSAAIALNDGGDVVGWASLSGDREIHASLWRNSTMTDLGTVNGDPCSVGYSVNARGQVVGSSSPCDFSQFRAFLWEGGSIVDLNRLVPPDSTLYLTSPETINDRGEIVGIALDASGNQHAFLLIPCGSDDSACQDAAAGTPLTRVAPLPAIQESPTVNEGNPVRQLLRRRLGFGRFAGSPQKVKSNAVVTPTSLTFSTQAIGTTSAAKIVALKNTGTASLTITGISITGAHAGDFAQTHTCGGSLAAGASCSISVRFNPTASGTRTAALSITDNAAGSPQKVSLSGTGTAGRCAARGQQCARQLPPCCPGLVCMPASTRAFCEPGALENTSRSSSYWDQLNANKLE